VFERKEKTSEGGKTGVVNEARRVVNKARRETIASWRNRGKTLKGKTNASRAIELEGHKVQRDRAQRA